MIRYEPKTGNRLLLLGNDKVTHIPDALIHHSRLFLSVYSVQSKTFRLKLSRSLPLLPHRAELSSRYTNEQIRYVFSPKKARDTSMHPIALLSWHQHRGVQQISGLAVAARVHALR